MLKVVSSNRFKKDLKTAEKRGYDFSLLRQVVNTLAAEAPLPPQNRDHALVGNYAGYRECHIAPDWLLIYQIDGDALELLLMRTGTHGDLF